MTGGVAYVWDPKAVLNRYLAETSPANRRLLDMERLELHALIDSFSEATASPVARTILDDWDRQADRFWILRAEPTDPAVAAAVVGRRSGNGRMRHRTARRERQPVRPKASRPESLNLRG